MKKKLLLCLLPVLLFSVTACDGKKGEEPKDYVLENWDKIVQTISEKGFTSTMHLVEEYLDADITIETNFLYKYDIYRNWEYHLVKTEIEQESSFTYDESYIDFNYGEGAFIEYSRTDEYMDFTKSTSSFVPGTRGPVVDGKHDLGVRPNNLAHDEEAKCYFSLDEDGIRTEYRFDRDYNLVSVTSKYDIVFDEEDEIPGRCHAEMTKSFTKIGETVVPALDPRIIAQ